MTKRVRAVAPSLVFAWCLVVTGCGGGGDAEKPLTLGGALGWSDPFSDDARERQAQDLLADCMADQGWTYVPMSDPYAHFDDADDEEYQLETIRQMGLGVAINYLLGGQGVSVGDNNPVSDPNADYVASLTPDEQRAYYKSFYGVEDLQRTFEADSAVVTYFDPSTGVTGSIMGVPGGCELKYLEYRFADYGQTPEQEDLVKQYYEAIAAEVKADPRTTKLESRWSLCMHDAGFDYSDRQNFTSQATADFTSRALRIVPAGFEPDIFSGMNSQQQDDFWEEATEQDWAALKEDYAARIDPKLRSELEALLAEEVDVAMAEHNCSKALQADADAIAEEVEDAYVRDHQDQIAALALSLAGKG